MKTVSDSDVSRMDVGRLFHTRGSSMAKDRSLNDVLVGGTSSLVIDDDPSPDWQWMHLLYQWL